MKKWTAGFIFSVLFIFVLVVKAGDMERLGALKKISAQRWDRISSGLEPWPAEIFPISYWPEGDRRKLPAEYWTKLEKCEKKWPEFINNEFKLFRAEYGRKYKNNYDLFLKEQAVMAGADYQNVSAPVKARKTLRRLVDISFLQAKNFQEISGTAAYKVRVFSYRQDKLRIIPFDILEFTAEDAVVLPSGPEGNPKDGDNLFNGNDRLFFMAVDAGHQISVDYIKKKYPSVKKVQEVDISYAGDKEKGWVYVASFDADEPALSPMDNLEFYPDYSIFFTTFVYSQCEPRKMDGSIVPTLKTATWCAAPGIGGIPFDFHDHLRVRINLKFVLGGTEDNEDNSNISWRAWYQGRVINYNRAAWKVTTPLGIGAPVIFDDIVVSAFSVYNYISWRTPFDPSLVMKYLDVRVGEELNDRVLQYRDILKVYYLTEKDRKGFQADGVLSDAEKTRDNGYSYWHLYTCFVDSVLMRTSYDGFIRKNSRTLLEWADSSDDIGTYDNHLIMDAFKSNHNLLIEWSAVPFFWSENPAGYNWKNLNTVLRWADKPLSYRIDGGKIFTPGSIVHIPDIQKEQDKYKY